MCTEISSFIINTIIRNSTETQYCVYFDEIEHHFNIKLNSELINRIYNDLIFRDEVADVELNVDHFDIVLYTSYTGE